jgi:hypothetical protein
MASMRIEDSANLSGWNEGDWPRRLLPALVNGLKRPHRRMPADLFSKDHVQMKIKRKSAGQNVRVQT